MGIVTKQGDQGHTRLFSGEELSKADARVEAYGTLDELGSQLGFARSLIRDEEISRSIRALQLDLFRFATELATTDPAAHDWVEPTEIAHLERLDVAIRSIEGILHLPASFIVPGACEASAAVDVARTIARRFERRLVALAESGVYTNPAGLTYANRISDYLFLLARSVERSMGISFDVKGSL
jgi:cob(I)alamin adenosyltransferase